jgi:hypothetical protein
LRSHFGDAPQNIFPGRPNVNAPSSQTVDKQKARSATAISRFAFFAPRRYQKLTNPLKQSLKERRPPST